MKECFFLFYKAGVLVLPDPGGRPRGLFLGATLSSSTLSVSTSKSSKSSDKEPFNFSRASKSSDKEPFNFYRASKLSSSVTLFGVTGSAAFSVNAFTLVLGIAELCIDKPPVLPPPMKPTAETSCTGAYVNICPALWV